MGKCRDEYALCETLRELAIGPIATKPAGRRLNFRQRGMNHDIDGPVLSQPDT
jgi:hypothetical protein